MDNRRKGLHWGSENQMFEYRKHLNKELFEVQISIGLVFKGSIYVLYPKY